jgi:hypothetical protein
MDSKLEQFRQCAADCRQLAVAAPSEFAKQHWLAMSSHWMKMAAAEEAGAKMATAPRPFDKGARLRRACTESSSRRSMKNGGAQANRM